MTTSDAEPVRPVEAPLTRPIRLGVLISGGGTTLMNFIRQIAEGRLSAEIPLVIASRPDAAGIAKARAAGLAVEVISPRSFPTVARFSEAIFARMDDVQIDLMLLAGFLSRIDVPERHEHRVMNIHPALIPAFCGKGYYGHRVHEAVLERGARVSGCTVHFADREYDHGPIVAQRCVPVLDDDTPEALAARVFEAECEAYPEAVRLFAQGRLEVFGRRVRVLPAADPPVTGRLD